MLLKDAIELKRSELEEKLRDNPGAAEKFINTAFKQDFKPEDLSPVERGILTNALLDIVLPSETQNILKALKEQDFVRTPPTPEEFLDDPKYLGETSKSIYPKWRETLLYTLNPKNEIFTHIYSGAIGTGKCVSYNTFIYTDIGMMTIEEAYNNRKYIKSVLSEVGYRSVKYWHEEGISSTIKVDTEHGFSLEGRLNHKVRVFNGINFIWKELSTLMVGDIVVIKNNIENISSDVISEELAELFGIIVGDGYVNRELIEITFGKDEDSVAYRIYTEHLLSKLGIRYCIKENNAWRLVINNVKLIKEWNSFGLFGIKQNKRIPWVIIKSSLKVKAKFIRGLFDTDGTVISRTFNVELTTISALIAKQLQLLLLEFGIMSSLNLYEHTYNVTPYYKVRLLGRDSKSLYYEKIGFSFLKKRNRLQNYLQMNTRSTGRGAIIIPINYNIIAEVKNNIRKKGLNFGSRTKSNQTLFCSLSSKGKIKFS